MKEEELKKILIYPDGSGNAYQQSLNALREIAKKKESIAKIELFVEKHQEVLAGVSYTVSLFHSAEIEIWCGGKAHYRQEVLSPKELAHQLFPDAEWERVKDQFSENYHYEALIDGVLLRLQNAEPEKRQRRSEKPKRTPLFYE